MMAVVESQTSSVQMIPLAEIHTDHNVRERLLAEEVDQLASSIALLGQLTPVSVRPDTERGGYMLIAGHKRHAALTQLGHREIRAEIRASEEDEAAERAAENIVRSQLNAAEEAVAVQAMFDRGATADGVAQALGWSRQRVNARVRLLELPDSTRQLVGAGVIPLSAVEELQTIKAASPKLLDVLVSYIAEHGAGAGERLLDQSGWLLSNALADTSEKVFAARLDSVERVPADFRDRTGGAMSNPPCTARPRQPSGALESRV